MIKRCLLVLFSFLLGWRTPRLSPTFGYRWQNQLQGPSKTSYFSIPNGMDDGKSRQV